MHKLIVRQGIMKHAAEEDGPSFEQQFGILANAMVTDKFPQLNNMKLAFQLIEKSDDNQDACGATVYLVGRTVIFVPAFFQSNTNYLAKSNESLNEGYRSYTDGLIENFVTYDGKIGLHHLNAVAGYTFQRESYHNLVGIGYNFPEPYYLQTSNATSWRSTTYESEHVLISYIGRVNYDYDGKYLFQATVRRDGSSRLSSDGHWGWFPSFSAGWRIDKEKFFNVDPKLVSLLKLRASYGVLGNENIGEYQYMDVMSRDNYTYSFGDNKVTGSAISNYVNTAIRWEKKKTLDIGLDYAMFNGDLEFTADWYDSVSEDLLYSVAVPAEAGATNTTVTMNAASMRNSGLELALSYHNYHSDLLYDISANVTFPRNEVLALGMGETARNDAYTRTEVGREVGMFYGYVYEGIFQSRDQIDNRVNSEGLHVNQNGAQPGDVVLDVKGLTVPSKTSKKNAVHDVSFQVRSGEIVCIAGIDGNGQTELVYGLTGLTHSAAGTLTLCGKDISHASIRHRSQAGISHIPEDRHKHGLVLDDTLENNIVLQSFRESRFQTLGFIKRDAVRSYAEKIIDQYDVRSGQGPVTVARSMSGGNQQKAIIGREIDRENPLLIAVQPTRGLDVGAIEYIHKQLVAQRDAGKAILLVSLELDEVMNLADRILVMYEGEIVGELDPKTATPQELGLYMAGAKRMKGGEEA